VGSAPNVTAVSAPLVDSKTRGRLPWLVAGVTMVGLLVALPFAVRDWRHKSAEETVFRFPVAIPEKAAPVINFGMHNLAVSPDGRRLAFVLLSEGQTKLWVRGFGALAAQPVPGTEGAYSPFWSPDSRYIAFLSGDRSTPPTSHCCCHT
jgi:hypothetical protein